MEYARLGSTRDEGLAHLPRLHGVWGRGAWVHKWVLNEENSRPIIQKALEMGINFFDTANVYSIGASEEILGRALKDFAKRDEVVIATKVHGKMREGPNGCGLSRKAILSEIDNSLKRLGTDYVDLYQIHRWDYETPIEETMEALNDVVRAGKARYIGASAMFAWQFQKALHVAEKHGWTRFVSMQDHLNLIYREEEREMLPLCRAEKIGVIPYSPLASGRLTRDWSSESTLRSETDQIAEKQIRCDRRNRSTGRGAGCGNRGKAWGSARAYRAGLAVAEGAGDCAHHRGNQDLASGRCHRRSVRETDPGRGRIPGRAVCAASHRWSSVNRAEEIMEYIRFGNTGMKVSRICLGCMSYGDPAKRYKWALNEEQSRPLHPAREWSWGSISSTRPMSTPMGMSEIVVGRAMKEFASRDGVVITTKVYQTCSRMHSKTRNIFRSTCRLSALAIYIAVAAWISKLANYYSGILIYHLVGINLYSKWISFIIIVID